ncbi:MAG: dockerin type I domain-containing protein [Wujia sp.]
MKKYNKILYVVLAFVLVLTLSVSWQPELCHAAETDGSVTADYVYFRETPGGTPIKDTNGITIMLMSGQKVSVLDTTNTSWYKVTLSYGGNTYTGYVSSAYISMQSAEEQMEAQPSSDADFEAELSAEGFPESYKVYLRKLHSLYPEWKFKAIQTGIDWNTLLENEVNKTGQIKNLVYGSSSYPHYNWRSTTVGYNYATDTWSPYDGTVWYAASDELVAYYLDPRTYLYENYIFVFESLSYQKGVQNKSGVEAILKGSFMYKTTPSGESKTYSQLIMDAAAASSVSPYHIASRIRLEMGTTAGVAASGTSAEYPGIYNFYNIGATDTANGSPVIKGLAWAAKSGSYGRPWNTVAKSITGGAQFLGASYISVGQNTLYTQKFNVTNKGSLFSHQYMTNVQAPATECLTNYNAYKNNNLLNSSMLFEIPVYKNMPSSAVSKPADSGNPNNWLKSLSVSGYSLTPTFGVNKTTKYSLIVDESVKSVKVSASPVNSAAKVSGAGTYSLSKGDNKVTITVTAQNGSTRKYVITIVRGSSQGGGGGSSEPSDTKKGDVNGDGKISVLDIVKIQRVLVGLDTPDDETKKACDINGDGKITVIDIVKLQRHIVGIETLAD